MIKKMTSMERVLAAVTHKEPDKVPLMLLFSHYGAKILEIDIKAYFESPEKVAKAQSILLDRYKGDCLYGFQYAAIETEAWGGEVVFSRNGPPNAGEPLVHKADDILNLRAPSVLASKPLLRNLEAISLMRKNHGAEVPIIGVVMSPFSVPVMQLGFELYLNVIIERRDLFDHLMHQNELFCVEWANRQLEAGATAICYFDPLASPTIISRQTYLQTGFSVAKRTISKIKGPTATHLASGRVLGVVEDIASTGTAIVGVGDLDDLSRVKELAKGKITILGNLNGIEMCRFDAKTMFQKAKESILTAGHGGGFLFSDGHGEVPYQVEGYVLEALSEAVQTHGVYPLKLSTEELPK